MSNKYQSFMDSKIGADTAKAFGNTVNSFVSNVDKITTGLGSSYATAGSRYMSMGKGISRGYKNTVGAFGKVISGLGNRMQYESRTAWNLSDLRGGARTKRGRLSSIAGRMTRGVGNAIQNPGNTLAGGARITSRLATKGPGFMGSKAKAFRRGIKSIPKPIRKMGLVGGIALGATAMLGVSVLKGAMDQGRQIAYDRYMEDAAQSQNILSSTRLGNASGTNRMLGYGGTVGLSNSLIKTRHGRR